MIIEVQPIAMKINSIIITVFTLILSGALAMPTGEGIDVAVREIEDGNIEARGVKEALCRVRCIIKPSLGCYTACLSKHYHLHIKRYS
jgi:hypothetical protein